MLGYRSFIFIKFMTLWNNTYLLFNNTTNRYKNIIEHIKNYYYGYHDTWLFMDGHTFPLSLNSVHNKINASWMYDNYDNTLMYVPNCDTKCSISWLSTQIKIGDEDYNIDNFIEQLTIYTDTPPSLSIIFMSWCAYTKNWFSTDIEFHIIDNTGADVILSIYDELYIANNKLYIKKLI